MSDPGDTEQARWSAWATRLVERKQRVIAAGFNCDGLDQLFASIHAADWSAVISIKSPSPDNFVASIEWQEAFDPEHGARLRFEVWDAAPTMLDALIGAVDLFLYHRQRIGGPDV